MTDGTPTRTDAPWLALALRDIAEASPVGPAPGLDEIVRGPRRHPGPGRVLAIAAVLVVVVAIAAAVVRSGDGSSEEVPGSVETAAPTGWYVPIGLPDGWTVRSVTIIAMETRSCPCRDTIWADPFSAAWAGYSVEPADGHPAIGDIGSAPLAGGANGQIPSDATEEVDLGAGITGRLVRFGPEGFQIEWIEGDEARSVATRILPRERAVAIARSLVGEPGLAEAPEHGWDRIHDATQDGAFDTRTLVDVELGTPDGRVVRYLLLPTGEAGRFEAGLERTERAVDGQPLAVTELSPTPGQPLAVHPLTGRWPGADVVIDRAEGQPAPTQSELDEVARSLRPATAAQWRTFLRDAGVEDPRLTEAPTVADLDQSD